MNAENEADPPKDEPASTASEGATERPGPADVQAYIGRQLRAVYDDVAKQPIPDRFVELMRQLEGQSFKG